MGTFDTFLDDDGTEHQSKAFGKNMATYRVGDHVQVRRAPFTHAEYETWLRGEWDTDPGRGAGTCQVQTHGGYLNVCTHRFTGTTSDRDRNVPLFDHFGRNVTALEAQMSDPAFTRARQQATMLCHAHRTATLAAYQTPDLAEEYNRAVAALLVHCTRLLVQPPPEVLEPVAHARYLAAATAERDRIRSEEDAEKEALGISDYDPATCTPRQQRAFNDWCQNKADRAVSRLLTSVIKADPVHEVVPSSVFVLGTRIPEDPEPMPLSAIASVFMAVMEPFRVLSDADHVFAPTRPALSPRRAGQRIVRPVRSGETRYADMVTRFREAGLVGNEPGPGWAAMAKVYHSV